MSSKASEHLALVTTETEMENHMTQYLSHNVSQNYYSF